MTIKISGINKYKLANKQNGSWWKVKYIMTFKISNEEIRNYLSKGCKIVEKIVGESLNQIDEKAFCEAIEIGIKNTIATLYEAKVKDDEIIRIVNKHWGIDTKEVEERLLHEKQKAPIRELQHYLEMQGWTHTKIQEYMKSNNISIKLRHHPELWKLKDNPERLKKDIEKLK